MPHVYTFFSMSAKNALLGNAASYAASVGTHVGSPFEDKTSQFESSAQLVSLVALAHVITSMCVASLPPNVTANDLNNISILAEQEVPSYIHTELAEHALSLVNVEHVFSAPRTSQ